MMTPDNRSPPTGWRRASASCGSAGCRQLLGPKMKIAGSLPLTLRVTWYLNAPVCGGRDGSPAWRTWKCSWSPGVSTDNACADAAPAEAVSIAADSAATARYRLALIALTPTGRCVRHLPIPRPVSTVAGDGTPS